MAFCAVSARLGERNLILHPATMVEEIASGARGNHDRQIPRDAVEGVVTAASSVMPKNLGVAHACGIRIHLGLPEVDPNLPA